MPSFASPLQYNVCDIVFEENRTDFTSYMRKRTIIFNALKERTRNICDTICDRKRMHKIRIIFFIPNNNDLHLIMSAKLVVPKV